ncbi:MAG: sugar ABC transporter permease, partial [Lachnospiraceae bacterium]|nr:sugar ABC transporter permease [Lachnospiraceae bacterium]
MRKSKTPKYPKQKLTGAQIRGRMKRYRWFYLMAVPAIVCAILFHYYPMIGIRFAFTNYNGIKEPAFVGLENFKKMFGTKDFLNAFRNTVEISFLSLIFQISFAVIISILLNEISNIHLKKVAQTIIYL